MKNKILVLFVLGIFLFSFVSATLPDVKQNQCVQIRTILNTASVNISSITYPNETTLFLNEFMTKNALTFNFTFCGTDLIGKYDYSYFSEDGDVFVNDFLVTPSGRVSTTGESILYFVLTVIMFFATFGMFYLSVVLPYRNARDDEGNVVEIILAKYLKVMVIALTYPIIMITLNLMNGLAVNFTSLTIFSGIIGFLFEVMVRLAWPWTIIMGFWIIYLMIRDSNFSKIIKKYYDF